MNKKSVFALVTAASIITGIAATGQNTADTKYPDTQQKPTPVERVEGRSYIDPYLWLENTEDASVSQWLADQDNFLQSTLWDESKENHQKEWLDTMRGHHSFERYTTPKVAANNYYYTRTAANSLRPNIYVKSGINSQAVQLPFPDVDIFDGDEKPVYIGGPANTNTIWPSFDGRFLAVGYTDGKSNSMSLRVVDTQLGKIVGQRIQGLYIQVSNVSWSKDSKTLYATQYQIDENGSPVSPKIISASSLDGFGSVTVLPYRAPSKDTIVNTVTYPSDDHILLAERKGSSQTNALYRLSPNTYETTLLIDNGISTFVPIGKEGEHYLLYTRYQAPAGQIVSVSEKQGFTSLQTIVPEQDEVMSGSSQVGGNALGYYGQKLYILYTGDGGIPLIRVYDRHGTQLKQMTLPIDGNIWGGFQGEATSDHIVFRFLGLFDPSLIYKFDPEKEDLDVILRAPTAFDRKDFMVRRVFVERDGIRIPMLITHRRDIEIDGTNPGYIYGYGAFGWISFLWYQPHIISFLEQGGVYAQPAVRGGGEYGAQWHASGVGPNRQNAIDDYIAASSWLIEKGYVAKNKLIANGGSASGMLAAAALVQRPDLYAGGIIDIPLIDMLRYDLFAKASYFTDEFGAATTPEMFDKLAAYSPYHNIRSDVCYPPTLITAGMEDETAHPMNAYKFAARLQNSKACSGMPHLLHPLPDTGHSLGGSIEQLSKTDAVRLRFIEKLGLFSQSSQN